MRRLVVPSAAPRPLRPASGALVWLASIPHLLRRRHGTASAIAVKADVVPSARWLATGVADRPRWLGVRPLGSRALLRDGPRTAMSAAAADTDAPTAADTDAPTAADRGVLPRVPSLLLQPSPGPQRRPRQPASPSRSSSPSPSRSSPALQKLRHLLKAAPSPSRSPVTLDWTINAIRAAHAAAPFLTADDLRACRRAAARARAAGADVSALTAMLRGWMPSVLPATSRDPPDAAPDAEYDSPPSPSPSAPPSPSSSAPLRPRPQYGLARLWRQAVEARYLQRYGLALVAVGGAGEHALAAWIEPSGAFRRRHGPPTAPTLVRLLHLSASAGQLPLAQRVWHALLARKGPTDAMAAELRERYAMCLMRAHVRADDLAGGLRLLDQLEADGVIRSRRLYWILLGASTRCGDHACFADVLMRCERRFPGPPCTITWNHIILAVGQLHRGLGGPPPPPPSPPSSPQGETPLERRDVVHTAVQAFMARHGVPRVEAGAIIETMMATGPAPNVSTLNAALQLCQLDASGPIRAQRLFRMLTEEGGVCPDGVTFRILANMARRSGLMLHSEYWLQTYIRAMPSLPPSQWLPPRMILRGYLALNHVDRALAYLDEMEATMPMDAPERAGLYADLIAHASRHDDHETARHWLRHAQQMGVRGTPEMHAAAYRAAVAADNAAAIGPAFRALYAALAAPMAPPSPASIAAATAEADAATATAAAAVPTETSDARAIPPLRIHTEDYAVRCLALRLAVPAAASSRDPAHLEQLVAVALERRLVLRGEAYRTAVIRLATLGGQPGLAATAVFTAQRLLDRLIADALAATAPSTLAPPTFWLALGRRLLRAQTLTSRARRAPAATRATLRQLTLALAAYRPLPTWHLGAMLTQIVATPAIFYDVPASSSSPASMSPRATRAFKQTMEWWQTTLREVARISEVSPAYDASRVAALLVPPSAAAACARHHEATTAALGAAYPVAASYQPILAERYPPPTQPTETLAALLMQLMARMAQYDDDSRRHQPPTTAAAATTRNVREASAAAARAGQQAACAQWMWRAAVQPQWPTWSGPAAPPPDALLAQDPETVAWWRHIAQLLDPASPASPFAPPRTD
ncbi:hypothetical protein CXG81DRAFT_26285 [Caulochytrium protostelioides]|uniref:Pentacotripeptide-repeat region of PRORP domain-containing protein n=1 Tax=Caulochytrium protostelioides TaxID=1555241 RepID=A0A4P9X739_9FUNG|nr:hypothetical protein CXG81DRAFT_26285 [Caulochytrium protostelioides]|eukprot:RKP01033.1 hypothetical protein CXG81DRAFT_26285 [Caulochytrium protostelioides]